MASSIPSAIAKAGFEMKNKERPLKKACTIFLDLFNKIDLVIFF
jgi:hypothetical protein